MATIALTVDVEDRTNSRLVGRARSSSSTFLPVGRRRARCRPARRPALAQAPGHRRRPVRARRLLRAAVRRQRARDHRSRRRRRDRQLVLPPGRARRAAEPRRRTATCPRRTRCCSRPTGRQRPSARSLGGVLTGASGPHVVYWINAARSRSRRCSAADPGPAAAERAGDQPRPLARPRRGIRRLPPLARAALRAGRVGVRDAASGRSTSPRSSSPSARYTAGDFGFGLLWAASGLGLVARQPLSGSLAREPRRRRDLPARASPWAAGISAPRGRAERLGRRVAMVLAGFGNGRAVVVNSRSFSACAGPTCAAAPSRCVISAHYALLGVAHGRRRRAHRPRRRALDLRRRVGLARHRLGSTALALVARPHRAVLTGAQQAACTVAGRRDWTRETLAAGVRAGDHRALARAITLVENGDPLAYAVVADIYPETGHAHAVGITGPPGVGKSSLDLGADPARPRARGRPSA